MWKHPLSIVFTCLGLVIEAYGPPIGTLLIAIGKALES
jgi:hypothetical protein